MPFTNVIDNTSTTVAASTPGITVDLRYHTTLRLASVGVPVRFKVYVSSTAGDTGAVKLLDSTGATVLSVLCPNGTGWYWSNGYLPATLAKYDIHYGGNTAAALSVTYAGCYEIDWTTDAVSATLGATLGAMSIVATGTVATAAGISGDLTQTLGAMTIVATGGAWTVDATSSVAVPANSTEWTSLMAAASLATGNPSDLYLMQEASGNASDSIGSRTLTAAGTFSYQQTVTGWTRKSIKTTTGTAATLLNTGSFTNVNSESKLVILYAKTIGPTTSRTIYRFGDVFNSDFSLEVLATAPNPHLQGGNTSTRTAGASDFTGSVRPWVMRIDKNTNVCTVFTDQEKVTVSNAAAGAGTELCFGGDNSQTWFPCTTDYMYAAVFTGTAAQLTDAQTKTLLQTLGWTIPWS